LARGVRLAARAGNAAGSISARSDRMYIGGGVIVVILVLVILVLLLRGRA
jgi:hypothetical protein